MFRGQAIFRIKGGTIISKSSTHIHHRDDVEPIDGEREYGQTEFADPVNKKYPIDTEEHIHAAWTYINHSDKAAKYNPNEVDLIKNRIKRAAGKHGIEIGEDQNAKIEDR